MTYRIFLSDPSLITEKLLQRFENPISSKSCEHVAQVLLTWVNYHYNDFETNSKLYEFLELFDDRLQNHEDQVKRCRQASRTMNEFSLLEHSIVAIFHQFSVVSQSECTNHHHHTFNTRRCVAF